MKRENSRKREITLLDNQNIFELDSIQVIHISDFE